MLKSKVVLVNIYLHTYNHVIYVYLGISDAKVEQVVKVTDMDTVCNDTFELWTSVFIGVLFKPSEFVHTASL